MILLSENNNMIPEWQHVALSAKCDLLIERVNVLAAQIKYRDDIILRMINAECVTCKDISEHKCDICPYGILKIGLFNIPKDDCIKKAILCSPSTGVVCNSCEICKGCFYKSDPLLINPALLKEVDS